MLGVEIYRPMRGAAHVMHQAMFGLSAAQGIYSILDDSPGRRRRPAPLGTRSWRSHRLRGGPLLYPGTRRPVRDGLSFRAEDGEGWGGRPVQAGGKSFDSCACC